ncbi:hypothetical protein TRFO_32080 [Tritrichomonas foetus]|uniref:Right handed beta helix domain-containing protein n=1 Tax=Tritrichomonas foetus TaxID=1144522 RepID=A0A1J4JRX8_9EUKA|nr:hypothetical protein TRFO_32080 [Tritrichomonas foetus]|eukprot:OHT01192.1 hypothetical protein TRFO_32080 [Tritrichomonas foetus]
MIFVFLISLSSSTEYFVKWNGDDKTICHPMWPCKWEVAVKLFEREDIIQITDAEIKTEEQLLMFQNMTSYVFQIGGGIASNSNTKIDGNLFHQNTTDFFIEISPFNESLLYGFEFHHFHHPIISVRGMDLFLIVNCSFNNNFVSYDYPLISFCNVTVIMSNSSICNNSVEGSSIIGLSTSILGYFNGTIENNIQLSRGQIPLIEFTNGASEITNSTIKNNISPNSPLIGSWFFIIVIITNSTIENNFCGTSALIVGDSLAQLSLSNSSISSNRAALLHSMTQSSINLSQTIFSKNYAAGQALIFAPRSTIQFLNETIVSENIADSIISSQLSNETSLNLISTQFSNNTCTDTAFALSNSESKIENTSLSTNTVKDHPLISVSTSNFSMNASSFVRNWVMGKGNIIEVEDGSIDVTETNFIHNKSDKSGVFLISIEANDTYSFVFRGSDFKENTGNIVSSILFDKKRPPARFEYCNFSKFRFEEVNGDLNDDQLFHRCRFERSIKEIDENYEEESFDSDFDQNHLFNDFEMKKNRNFLFNIYIIIGICVSVICLIILYRVKLNALCNNDTLL